MKRAPINRKAEAARLSKLDALVELLDGGAGPMSAASLSRSYGLDESHVADILRKRGRLQYG